MINVRPTENNIYQVTETRECDCDSTECGCEHRVCNYDVRDIELAEIYTGEINSEDVYPQAIVVNDNTRSNGNTSRNRNTSNETLEERSCCDKEQSREALCMIFFILIVIFGYLIYISV